jgi:hypothetical protein
VLGGSDSEIVSGMIHLVEASYIQQSRIIVRSRLVIVSWLVQALFRAELLEVFQRRFFIICEMSQMALRKSIFHNGGLYSMRWT